MWEEEEEDWGEEMEGGGGAVAGSSLCDWPRLSFSTFDFRSSHLALLLPLLPLLLLLLGFCFSPPSSLLGERRCLGRGG